MKRGLRPTVKKQKSNVSDECFARSLANIRIILCRPIYGGNIGAVCRAMANMGLSDLTLVGAENINWDEARKMACSAHNILANHKSASAIDEAAADCVLVVGTTARLGLYRQHATTPRECAPLILETADQGKVALVFGPEDNGLNNVELGFCNRLIQIPSAKEYRSVNLSHAVMICAYELFTLLRQEALWLATGRNGVLGFAGFRKDAPRLAAGCFTAAGIFESTGEKSPPANTRTKEHMFKIWEDALLQIGFMEPDKAQHMMLGVRRIFSRGKLTEDDVRILMGIARQTLWCAAQMRDQQGKK